MGKRLTLILGGARSGKSDFAEALALKRGGGAVLFVATAEALDEEMRVRIDLHRRGRDPRWQTLEVPRAVPQAVCSAPYARVVLLDCVTLWVSNTLLSTERGNVGSGDTVKEMLTEVDDLLEWYCAAEVELIVVSNEVGMGLVPANETSRAYRDLLGMVNKQLASAADEVYWLCAGLAIEIKSRAVRTET